jgi:hypothetical protein
MNDNTLFTPIRSDDLAKLQHDSAGLAREERGGNGKLKAES